MNSYFMLSDLRDNVGEGAAAHWDDTELLRKLNHANAEIGFLVSQAPGDWLMKNTDLTPVASVITLPVDCAKPIYMEEVTSGRVIPIAGTVRERRRNRTSGAVRYSGYVGAYMEGNTIVVNTDGYTETITLWYEQEVRDLQAGTTASGSASTLQFDADNEPNGVDDYYNGVTVECMDATTKVVEISTPITDYVGSTYTATLVGTPVTSDFYGTVPEIPREGHGLIVLKATIECMAKPSSHVDPKVFEQFERMVGKAERRFTEWISTRVKNSQHIRNVEVLG